MRRRGSLTLLLFLILLLIILAQSGILGSILSTIWNSTSVFYGPTARPFATGGPLLDNPPGNNLLPSPPAPTAYLPPAYAPTNANQSAQATNPPAGSVSGGGQCIVPNGWTAYTIQQGETLAVIASAYGLTVQQLAAANCLNNPDLIYAGQLIAVPGVH